MADSQQVSSLGLFSSTSTNRQQRKRKYDIQSSDCDEYSDSIPSNPTDRESSPTSSSSNAHHTIDCSPRIISQHTCEWTQDTLDKLNITTVTTRAYKLFSLLDMVKSTDVNAKNEESVERCMNLILHSTNPMNSLDYSDLEEIECVDALKTFQMKFRNHWYRDIDAWDISMKNESDDKLDSRLCQKFRVHGEEFALQLLYMATIKKKHRLTEAMYQTLFQHFAAMLGLSSYGVPSVSGTCLTIGATKVTSIPKIIFPDLSSVDIQDENLKVLAVCEVKRDFKTSEDSTDRTSSNKVQEKVLINHIDDNLQGQHGGELLLHFPLSTYQGLLGIIVQKTYVTFSYFHCNKMQFDEIQNGAPTLPNKPYIYFSKPYNYLKACDRKELLEPLLRLGFIQCNPYK